MLVFVYLFLLKVVNKNEMMWSIESINNCDLHLAEDLGLSSASNIESV